MRILFAFCLALAGQSAAAHEFWIDSAAFAVESGAPFTGTLVNGQEFQGPEFAYFGQRIVSFERLHDGTIYPVDGRDGDRPAIQLEGLEDGLHVLAYTSTILTVNYDDWPDFSEFVDQKDLGDIRSEHLARGLPMGPFREAYSRYSKALVGVGPAAGEDRAFGLDIELVALDNPYTDDLSGGMRLRLERYGDIRPDSRVELFERAPDGTVNTTVHRTDADGIVTLPVRPGHTYLADSVILFVPDTETRDSTGAVWESDWAALTFSVPE